MYTREISDYSGFMFLAFMYLLTKLINHLLSRMISRKQTSRSAYEAEPGRSVRQDAGTLAE